MTIQQMVADEIKLILEQSHKITAVTRSSKHLATLAIGQHLFVYFKTNDIVILRFNNRGLGEKPTKEHHIAYEDPDMEIKIIYTILHEHSTNHSQRNPQ